MSYGRIYKATNLITGKCYIGQTVNFEKRKYEHINESRLFRDNSYFHKSIRKYGKENFVWEILCECSSKDELNEMEKIYIIELNTKAPNGYNLTDGGEGMSGWHHTDKTKQKISKSHLGINIGKKLSDETKRKIGEGNKGKKLSDEHKRKISEGHTGKKLSDEHKRKISEGHTGISGKNHHMYGKHHTEETKCKISKSQKLANHPKHTEETKQKISKLMKNKYNNENNPNAKIYKIIYPDGDIEIIKCLKKWCGENKLGYISTLRSINNKPYKGFIVERIGDV